MSEGKIDVLGFRMIKELVIQLWPKPLRQRKILREHLRMVKPPANVPVDK